MTINLACPNRTFHGVLSPEEGFVEIKCNRGYCGAGKGKIVLHRWSLTTGELLSTERYSTPTTTKEGASNGTR